MTFNVGQANAVVQEDRQITVTHTADKLDISCEDLRCNTICAS